MAIDRIDRTAKSLVLIVQDYTLFSLRAVSNIFRPPVYWPEFLLQSDIIGFGSLSIVVLSGLSTGGVLALQSASTLSEFGAAAVTGQFVSITMIRELGPVLTGTDTLAAYTPIRTDTVLLINLAPGAKAADVTVKSVVVTRVLAPSARTTASAKSSSSRRNVRCCDVSAAISVRN